ncbi:hypothetical protein FGB62_3g430 [Gracilaria domingensis]|nr:hypothetical protein FGB62_3g430 [Gracilaria domingensis]
MAEQRSASIAEKNAALRRGTRNRIAKRRPGFVDPFSLRKKRKTKVEGDELLSALSPCSEEGNLKVRLPQNTQSLDSTEKNHNSSSFEGSRAISEVVHRLPTSNPKVRVIIRRKPQPDVPNTASLKLVLSDKPVVKLNLRIKPPQPKVESNLVETSPTRGGRQQADTEPNSGVKVRKQEGGEIPSNPLRKSPLGKSPHKVITKVKLLVSPRRDVKRSLSDREENSFDRCQRQALESSQRPQKKRRNSESLENSEDSHATQTPTKSIVPIEDVTKRSNEKRHDVEAEHQKPQLKSEPKEDMKEVRTAIGMELKRTQSSEDEKAREESKLTTKTPKKNVNLALQAKLLPIRKRPYMREERASSSPVLRRSTRNRQRQGYSR